MSGIYYLCSLDFFDSRGGGAGGQSYQNEMTESGLLASAISISLGLGGFPGGWTCSTKTRKALGMIGHCPLRSLLCIEMGVCQIFYFSMMGSCCGHEVSPFPLPSPRSSQEVCSNPYSLLK